MARGSTRRPERPPGGGGFAIRAARPGDLAAITALDARVTSLPKESHWRELLARARRSRGGRQLFLVATAAGEPAALLGFIVGEVRAWEFGSEPCGWVYALAVDPDMRQQGIGAALLEASAAEFRRAGVSRMRTMVAKGNSLPMLFFRGEGMMAGPYLQLEKDLH